MPIRPTPRVLLPILLLGLAAASPAADPASDDEAVLRRIKLELWPRAYREQDVELLDRLLDPRFQMIDGEGRPSSKADELAWVAAQATSYDTFDYQIERLDVFAGSSAIVAGRGTVSGERDGQRWTHVYRSTNVLVKRDERWVAVASHVSPVAAP
jgi:hypothetical protein